MRATLTKLLDWKIESTSVSMVGDLPLGTNRMENDWIPRLEGHANLVQNLVQEVPKALDRRSLTLDQAERQRAVIEKGVRDFGEVLQFMDQVDVDEQYREAAKSLARTWQHLCDAAEDKVRSMREPDEITTRLNDEASPELNDNDDAKQADIDRKH